MCLVHSRGLAKEKHVDTQNLWIQYASKSKRFVTKKVGTNVNLADLMTKPLLGPTIVQHMKIMGYQFVEEHLERGGLDCTKLMSSRQRAEMIVVSLLLATATQVIRTIGWCAIRCRKCLNNCQDLTSARARGGVF